MLLMTASTARRTEGAYTTYRFAPNARVARLLAAARYSACAVAPEHPHPSVSGRHSTDARRNPNRQKETGGTDTRL